MEKLCELSAIKDSVIYLPTYYVYKKTMKNNFNCCEVWIRYLAMDHFYNKNNFGFDIYNEIQHYRVNQKKQIPRHQYDNEQNFRNLILSFEKNGFLKEYPLCLNKDFMVIDGAHRLTIALYMGIKYVPVCFKEKYYNIDFDYSLQWMRDNGFGKYESLLLNQYERIEEQNKDNKDV